MANPLMSDKAVNAAARAGWGAPDPTTRNTPISPITDGPVSGWGSQQTMTVGGTVSAAGVLLVLLLGAAVVGWVTTDPMTEFGDRFPGLAVGAMLFGFVLSIVLRFKPMWAKVLGPVYALAEGFFLGAISKAYNEAYEDGIVVQAVGATLAVFAVMLILYKTRIIKVTERFRRIVITAAMGLMFFYAVSFVIHLAGGSVPFLSSTSPMGILFSVLAAGLAAMMLAVNFDTIERGVAAGWPKGMEWYCAFGVVATLVWLYLEILRLLAKLQRR